MQWNIMLIHATTWMSLKNITLSERNQTRKITKCFMSHLYKILRKGKFIEADGRLVVTWV